MRIVPALLVLLATAALAGCGTNSMPESVTTTVPAPGPPPAQPASGFDDVEFGAGWQALERDAAGVPFRWMGTRATLTVRGSGGRTLAFTAASLAKPRTLLVRRSGRVVARAELPAKGGRLVEVAFPAGAGDTTLELEATPGASPASVVVPQDPRLLAVQVASLTVRAG